MGVQHPPHDLGPLPLGRASNHLKSTVGGKDGGQLGEQIAPESAADGHRNVSKGHDLSASRTWIGVGAVGTAGSIVSTSEAPTRMFKL